MFDLFCLSIKFDLLIDLFIILLRIANRLSRLMVIDSISNQPELNPLNVRLHLLKVFPPRRSTKALTIVDFFKYRVEVFCL